MASFAPPPGRTTTKTRDGYYHNTSLIPPSPDSTTTPTTPGLTQSTSNTESMQSNFSPSEPKTPMTPAPLQYYRVRPRYPHDMGRVPLHRRGTSKTYERLEDLLREAGYKETRIFTPEAERKRKGKGGEDDQDDEDDDDTTIVEDKRASAMKEGVGAVMGFLAGLVNVGGVTGGKNSTTTTSPPNSTSGSPSPTRCLVPSPPLANNFSTGRGGGQAGEARHQVPNSSRFHPHPEIVVHPTTPPPPHSNQYHRLHHQLRLQDQQKNQHQYPHVYPNRKGLGLGLGVGLNHQQQQEEQNGSGNDDDHNTTATMLVSPRPSRATAYLRHISSAPNMMPPMPPRPHSTPVHSRPHHSTAANHGTNGNANSNFDRSNPRTRRTLNLNIDTETENYDSEDATTFSHPHHHPPLPTTWLETVARAVLFGGAGAHIGRPLGFGTPLNTNPSSDPRVKSRQVQRQLRPSRSSISQASHHHRPTVKSPLSLNDPIGSGRRTARSGLSDQTNLTPCSNALVLGHANAVPPALFSSVSKKNLRGEVEVSLTRVICRSAPGSRAGSVVRSSEEGRGKRKRVDLYGLGGFDFGMSLDGDLEENLRGRGRVKRGWFGAGDQEVVRKKEKKDREHVRVPSLARTKVEGDVWAKTQRQGKAKSKAEEPRVNSKPKATTGYSYASASEVERELLHNSSYILASSDTEAFTHNDDDDDDDEVDHSNNVSASEVDATDDSDNSDSEPTLARMLLHPPAPRSPMPLNSQHPNLQDGQLISSSPVAKRQQSIKSLRRVLARGVPAASTGMGGGVAGSSDPSKKEGATSVQNGRGRARND